MPATGKCDILITGVGGQGVLSIGAIIAATSIRQNLHVKQSEVHGMSQRGGTVEAHLRLSKRPIHSDLVPAGTADLVLSMEPLESLRYLRYLARDGVLITAADPVLNMANYPDQRSLLIAIRELSCARLIEADELARRAGSAKARNMVMVGAASPRLPVDPETIEAHIAEAFAGKGEKIVRINLEAFRLGREAVASVPT